MNPNTYTTYQVRHRKITQGPTVQCLWAAEEAIGYKIADFLSPVRVNKRSGVD